MVPSLVVQRHLHPQLTVQFAGPIRQSVALDEDGDAVDSVCDVTRREALRAAALAGPRVQTLLRRLNLPVVGVNHRARDVCELRWVLNPHRGQGAGYYVLRVIYGDDVDQGKLYGRYYGYAECCTDNMGCWFNLPGYRDSILDGTGFVPCVRCHATHTPAELMAGIQSRRLCATPFPQAAHYIMEDFWRALAVQNSHLVVPLRSQRRTET